MLQGYSNKKYHEGYIEVAAALKFCQVLGYSVLSVKRVACNHLKQTYQVACVVYTYRKAIIKMVTSLNSFGKSGLDSLKRFEFHSSILSESKKHKFYI
jgi:hypothetical protein